MEIMLEEFWSLVTHYWPHILAFIHIVFACFFSVHTILYKRESRAAVVWLGVIWLYPVLGSFLYYIFGINRIQFSKFKGSTYKRLALRKRSEFSYLSEDGFLKNGKSFPEDLSSPSDFPHTLQNLSQLSELIYKIVHRPLSRGNAVTPLVNGEEAFPSMLESISKAQHTISLSTYIFDNDQTGRLWAKYLGEAARRGVQVKILLDDLGLKYSWPSITKHLRRHKVSFARFLPTMVPWHLSYMNLRNHRKILVVDGKVGHAGGMNIRHGNMVSQVRKGSAIQDIHFRLEGPIVAHLQETFVQDWAFMTKEILQGPLWFPPLIPVGTVLARGIADGPDHNFEKIRWTFCAAISKAQHSIRLLTPYFVPDSTLIMFLNIAALAGVRVEIIIPEHNNLLMVHWATRALIWQLLERGVNIYLSPAPFDHSKILLVDKHWLLFGSSNWDARSLRLNFEFNVECYHEELALQVHDVFEKKLALSRKITFDEIESRSLLVKLRDGAFRLFSPYL